MVGSNHTRTERVRNGVRGTAWMSRLATLALLGALSTLTACGGGGGGGGDNNTTVTPSAVEPDVSGHFAVALTEQHTSSTAAPRQAHIVNLDTHSVVRSYTLASDTDQQYVLSARHQPISASATQLLGGSHLFLIQSGRVVKVDLRGPLLGKTTQVSAVNTACLFTDTDPDTNTPEGEAPWLSIETAGADGHCDTVDDNRTVLIQGNMAASALPVASGAQGVELIENLDGSTPGVATAILGWDHVTNRLGVYSADLKTRNQNVPLVGSTLTPTTTVRELGYVANDPQAFVLQVGANLHVARFASGTLTLSKAIYTMADTQDQPHVLRQGSDTYVVNRAELVRINASQVATQVQQLERDAGEVEAAYLMGDKLVAMHHSDPNSDPVVSTLIVYPLDGSSGWILDSVDGTKLWLLGAQGGEPLVMTVPQNLGASQLLRYALDGSGSTVVESSMHLLAATLPSTFNLAAPAQPGQLVYCRPTGGISFCAGNAVVAMDVATGDTRVLGTVPADASLMYSIIFDDDLQNQRVAGRLGLLSMRLIKPVQDSTAVWQFNPTQAGSLVRVSGTP